MDADTIVFGHIKFIKSFHRNERFLWKTQITGFGKTILKVRHVGSSWNRSGRAGTVNFPFPPPKFACIASALARALPRSTHLIHTHKQIIFLLSLNISVKLLAYCALGYEFDSSWFVNLALWDGCSNHQPSRPLFSYHTAFLPNSTWGPGRRIYRDTSFFKNLSHCFINLSPSSGKVSSALMLYVDEELVDFSLEDLMNCKIKKLH